MLELSPWLWIIALTSSLVASVITTITGVGAGLIIYGVLSFFLDLKIIIPLVAPAQFLSGVLRVWVFRQHLHWRLAGYFFLGVLPGIYGGTLLFHALSEVALRRLLGVFLLGFAAYELLQRHSKRLAPHVAWLPLGGVGAGLLLGSVGVPGPLLAVVFLRYGLMKEELVAMIALFFLLGNAQRTLLYWQQGTLASASLGLALAIGVVMIVGVEVGRRILPRLSREVFVKLVLGMLIVFGVKFLLW
jgi:uncharacterized membrane protein YfcA